MRLYYFYFSSPDNPDDPMTHSHNETIGIKAENRENAIDKFYKMIPKGYTSQYKIQKIDAGPTEKKIMKLTKEDVQKYGTEKEKKVLKESEHTLNDDYLLNIILELNDCIEEDRGMGPMLNLKKSIIILQRLYDNGYDDGQEYGSANE